MKNFLRKPYLAILAICLTLLFGSTIRAKTPNLFNYQGHLSSSDGSPLNGNFQVTFTLYSAPVAGFSFWQETQQITCTNGVFNILLGTVTPLTDDIFHYSPDQYLGVKLGADPEMVPRKRLVSSPYAHRVGSIEGAAGGHVSGASSFGAIGIQSVPGVTGFGDLYGGDFASYQASGSAIGLYGHIASLGAGFDGTGVKGWSVPLDGFGYGGDFVGGYIGCRGTVTSHTGSTFTHIGLYGETYDYASAASNYGAYTRAGGGLYNIGIRTEAYNSGSGPGALCYGIYATGDRNDGAGGWAGYFDGWTTCNGTLQVLGTLYKPGGAFRIDHPLDPEKKYLQHSFVESPDMKNIYDGIVVLDANGRATVKMPDWFEALNRDFRYQLTAIGESAPGLYISKKVENNQFGIAGGNPGMEVSWTVTGIRHDAYANANRIQVEVDKPSQEKGLYVSPEAYGFGREKHIHARIFEQLKKTDAEMAMRKAQEEKKK